MTYVPELKQVYYADRGSNILKVPVSGFPGRKEMLSTNIRMYPPTYHKEIRFCRRLLHRRVDKTLRLST